MNLFRKAGTFVKKLNETDIRNIMKGASLLGSGGGGSMSDGLIMLEAFKKHHIGLKIEVELVDPDEMSDDYAVGAAVMGAPSEGTNQDITDCIVNAYDEICCIADRGNCMPGYVMALELGGVNTFAPMLISLMQSVPIIDADCAGRAVPGLDTVLAALLGCPTAPIAMADVYDNRIDLLPVNAYDAEMIEKLALPIVSSFKQNAGIAGWLCNKEMVKTTMVQHSISKALKIGELISSIKSKDQAIRLFDELRRLGLANARTLTKPSKIEDFKVTQQGGWDIGEFIVGSADARYHLIFSNESLLLYQMSFTGNEKLVMSAPDIIALINASTGEAVTNDDLQTMQLKGELETLEVVLGIIQANELWHQNEDVNQCWRKYFAGCGYHGMSVSYSE